MPTYKYRCVECENEFDEHRPIDEHDYPTKEPCSHCNGEIRKVIGLPGVSYGHTKRPPETFRKRMEEIKEAHPLHNIPEY